MTGLKELNKIILNLPVTTLLFMGEADGFIYPFRFSRVNHYASYLKSFEENLQREGIQLTQEEVEKCFDQTQELETHLGISIKKALALMDNGDNLKYWNCNCSGCKCEGDDFHSFIDHHIEQHSDNLCGLKIIWSDIIRWIR